MDLEDHTQRNASPFFCYPSKRKNDFPDTFDEDDGTNFTDEVVNVSKKIKLMKLPASPMEGGEEGSSFPIMIKTLSGKTIEITIEAHETIQKIKERVEEMQGIPPDQQRLIFNGRTMAETRTATSYSLTHGSVLHLVLALRGG